MNTDIILFWSKFDKESDVTHDEWVNREIRLSPFHMLSLYSHLLFGHDVYLFTYQNITSKVPGEMVVEKNDIVFPGRFGHIVVADANDVLNSEWAFSALSKGHSIAHISDYVRLKVATELNGIIIDLDAVVVNELPNCESFFSTMPAKATGGFAPQWGESHPPFTIHDNSWDGKALSAFPLKVSDTTTPYIEDLSCKILNTLSASPKKSTKAWNYIMWTLKDIASKEKDSKVFQPISFCPLPAWLSSGNCYSLESPSRLDGETELFGYTLPSVDKIFEESYTVQHFFESAFKDSKSVETDFWESVPSDCLIAKEAEHIFKNNWRETLISENNES